MSLKSNPLCIYHADCIDGFTSAWIVHEYFGNNIEFHPGIYTEQPPDVTGKDVIMVDFSYSKETIIRMAEKANSVLILDHHKSAQKNLESFIVNDIDNYQEWLESPYSLAAIFDMDRSGASLTWRFINPYSTTPLFIDYIEDHDLWRHQLPHSKEHNAALLSYDKNFETWTKLYNMSNQDLIEEGVPILRRHFVDINSLLKNMKRYMDIGGYIVPVASLPTTMASDAAHIMAEGEEFAACYMDTAEHRTFSLRSLDDQLDVSTIAVSYGGGGHEHAAGFSVPRSHPLAQA